MSKCLLKRWNGEEPPEELPVIKLKGILGSLGKKHGFGLVAEKPVTGRVARLLKIRNTVDVQISSRLRFRMNNGKTAFISGFFFHSDLYPYFSNSA